MNDDSSLNKTLMGSRSMLNVEAQKELVDHAVKASRLSAYKMMLVIFPAVILMVLVILGSVFYFVGILKF